MTNHDHVDAFHFGQLGRVLAPDLGLNLNDDSSSVPNIEDALALGNPIEEGRGEGWGERALASCLISMSTWSERER
jgi:hypothetical protein